ncbi:hypothetical protein [Blastococcus sp. SYSU D00813]
MSLRRASLVVVAVLMAGTAACSSSASETAALFFSLGDPDAVVDEQTVVDAGEEALTRAQADGDIPDSVSLRHQSDTMVLEVVAEADSSADAAETANRAVEELVARLNAAPGLDSGQLVVVELAEG